MLAGTNATASMRANSNPHVVAAGLGHTSIAVTLRHYTDPGALAEARQEAAMATLLPSKSPSKIFGRQTQKQNSPTSQPGQPCAATS